MHSIAIKAEVHGSGGFFFRQEHEWRGLTDEVHAYMLAALGQAAAAAKMFSATPPGDKDRLDATLSVVDDGKASLPARFTVSYTQLAEFQDFWDAAASQFKVFRRVQARAKQAKP